MGTGETITKKDTKARVKIPRQEATHLDPVIRIQTFDEVNRGMSDETIRLEALRCVACGKPTCIASCPIGNEMFRYIDLLLDGDLEGAIQVLKQTNPMPAIMGRICPHPCETTCVRGRKAEPVSINQIERYVGDMEIQLKREGRLPRPKPPEGVDLGRVAVIGAGPSGLTCAWDLALKGYKVTVFEKSSVPGGMLWLGIPEYRLPREVIEDFMTDVASLGIEIRYNTPLSKELTPDTLLAQGFQSVFIGIGAYKGLRMGIPGEGEYEGFLDCIVFLEKVNLGDKTRPGSKILVIGGGNSAIDAARTALRLGCEDVNIVYRRSRKEMPANAEEVDDAEAEGVKIHYLAAPVKILGKDGKVAGMEVIQCELGEPDASGRRKPVPIPGSEFVIEADVIIPAISQEPDLECLPEDHGLNISKWSSFVVDPQTQATNKPGIYSGGDAVTGPKTVVEAVAAGHRASRSIHEFCQASGAAAALS